MLSISTVMLINFIFLISTFMLLIVVVIDRVYWKQYLDDEQDLLIKISYDILPVLFIIMVVRTYIYEPFSIPSESMYPQLTKGDFILVSKTSYNIKFPFTNMGLIDTNKPQRSDVAVFQYPLDVNTYFVKRIVGVPGDKLVWKDNDMYINNQKVQRNKTIKTQMDGDVNAYYQWEYLNDQKHLIRKMANNEPEQFNTNYYFVKLRSEALLGSRGYNPDEHKNYLEINIPSDYYFVMGDNREQSSDSRSWGLVHKNYFVGKVKYIAFSLNPDVPAWKFWSKLTFSRNTSIH